MKAIVKLRYSAKAEDGYLEMSLPQKFCALMDLKAGDELEIEGDSKLNVRIKKV